MDAVAVRCLRCSRRLFDIDLDRPASGTILVRCPRCRDFSSIDLSSYTQREGKRAASAPESFTAHEPHTAPFDKYATKGLANGVGIPALVLGSLGFREGGVRSIRNSTTPWQCSAGAFLLRVGQDVGQK